jgi:polysaccharide export outer membrane protein
MANRRGERERFTWVSVGLENASGAHTLAAQLMHKWISSVVVAGVMVLHSAAFAQQSDKTLAKELLQYVQDAQKAGLKDAQIQENAVKAGWPSPDVVAAISYTRLGISGAPETTGAEVRNNAPEPKAAESREPAASTPASPEAAGSIKPTVIDRGVPVEYRIGEGDVVQVSVWGEPTASVSSVVVRPDGKITLPLIKDVAVAGLTPAEAEKLITDKLSAQIKAADVTVIVNQINSKKVFIVGAVKKEGPISYTYRMTVMQAISEAGGLTDYAKKKRIYVLRNENGRQYQLRFDYDAVLKGEHMELNIPLEPGDTLVIPH